MDALDDLLRVGIANAWERLELIGGDRVESKQFCRVGRGRYRGMDGIKIQGQR